MPGPIKRLLNSYDEAPSFPLGSLGSLRMASGVLLLNQFIECEKTCRHPLRSGFSIVKFYTDSKNNYVEHTSFLHTNVLFLLIF
jgi:hypothetical protein